VPQLPEDPLNNAPPLVNCLATYQPDIILLMSGTNGLNAANVEASLTALDRVIRTITTNAPKTRVIVSTIFDRWISTGWDAATRTYNAGIPALVTAAQQRGELVSFADCGGTLTRDDFCFGGVLGDGVHPNPAVAMPKVADVWFEGIKKVAPQ
jgi:lysophospholipase L1-like esterase